MSSKSLGLAAISLAFTGVTLPTQADARGSYRSMSVQGSGGCGYQRQRQASRVPGSTQVQRGIQTNSGRGIETARGHSCAGGTCTGGATHTTNDGTSWGRSGSVTANGDGSASYQGTRTGPAGGSSATSGTITRSTSTPPQ